MMMAAADAKPGGVVARAEELRHRGCLQALRELARAGAENPPGKQAAHQGVAQADPGGGHAVFPPELACIADEDNGGEVARAEREGRKPRADVAAA